jgi:hypothetical protein
VLPHHHTARAEARPDDDQNRKTSAAPANRPGTADGCSDTFALPACQRRNRCRRKIPSASNAAPIAVVTSPAPIIGTDKFL